MPIYIVSFSDKGLDGSASRNIGKHFPLRYDAIKKRGKVIFDVDILLINGWFT